MFGYYLPEEYENQHYDEKKSNKNSQYIPTRVDKKLHPKCIFKKAIDDYPYIEDLPTIEDIKNMSPEELQKNLLNELTLCMINQLKWNVDIENRIEDLEDEVDILHDRLKTVENIIYRGIN